MLEWAATAGDFKRRLLSTFSAPFQGQNTPTFTNNMQSTPGKFLAPAGACREELLEIHFLAGISTLST
jgi:hypothetical protein